MKDEKSEKETYIRVMTEYRSVLKYITQMALSALILPTFFLEDLLKNDGKILNSSNSLILISWFLLLVSIGSGIYYQYIATKKIIRGKKSSKKQYSVFFFGLTMWCFYGGVLFFILEVVFQ